MLRLRLHQRAAALRRLMHYGTSRHRKVHGDQPAAQEVCHRDRQTPHLAASALRMSSSSSRAHLYLSGRRLGNAANRVCPVSRHIGRHELRSVHQRADSNPLLDHRIRRYHVHRLTFAPGNHTQRYTQPIGSHSIWNRTLTQPPCTDLRRTPASNSFYRQSVVGRVLRCGVRMVI